MAVSLALFVPLAGLTFAGYGPFTHRTPAEAPTSQLESQAKTSVPAEPAARAEAPSPPQAPSATSDGPPAVIVPPVPRLAMRPSRPENLAETPTSSAPAVQVKAVDAPGSIAAAGDPPAAPPAAVEPAASPAAPDMPAPPSAATDTTPVRSVVTPPDAEATAAAVAQAAPAATPPPVALPQPGSAPPEMPATAQAAEQAADDPVESAAATPSAPPKPATNTIARAPAPAEAFIEPEVDTPPPATALAEPAATGSGAKDRRPSPASAAAIDEPKDEIVAPAPVPAMPPKKVAKLPPANSAAPAEAAAKDQKFATSVTVAKPQNPAALAKDKRAASQPEPASAPASVAYRKNSDHIIVYGRVRDEQERAAVLKAASSVFAGRKLVDHVNIDSGVGPVKWLGKAEEVVGLLHGLDGTGRIVVEGDAVTLSGFVGSESERTRHGEQASKLFGPAAKVENKLKAPQ